VGCLLEGCEAVNFVVGEPCFSCTWLSIFDACTVSFLLSTLTAGFGFVGGGLLIVFAVVEIGVGALGRELFGVTTLGAEVFRTDTGAVFDAGMGFVAVADFAATVFAGTGFVMALVDFALVVVVLMLSTSIGSETIFLGLPLFFATTSADML